MSEPAERPAALTKNEALAILDALSDDADNKEEEFFMEKNNPTFYGAILKLREFAK